MNESIIDFPHSSDSFLTLADTSEGLLKERGSRFLYFAFPVANEEEIKTQLGVLRKKYFDATHHCYAWVLGKAGEQYRANDDGEPNHSAGDPILGQIRSHQLCNVLIVVVRYFGGTKLGVSGLIQAYKAAAAQAILENRIVREWVKVRLDLIFPYQAMNEVMKLIKSLDLEILKQELQLECSYQIQMREGLLAEVSEKLEEIEGLQFSSC